MSATALVGSGRRWALRALAGAAGLTLLAVALIGFAHTKHGRPLLALLRGAPAGACPVGKDIKLSPEQHEQARAKALAPVRGAERALARPALGFALDATTRPDVERWASEKGVRCEPAKRDAALRCVAVPVAALPASATNTPGHDLDALLFVFDGYGRLVGLDASRDRLSAEEAAQLVEARAGAIAEEAGPPTLQRGVADGDYLAGGALRRIESEFRFSDYRAEVSATNLGRKVVVFEKYQSIPN